MSEVTASKAKPPRARGLKYRLTDFLLGGFVARLCEHLPWLHRRLNRHIINDAITVMPGRPYRLSTMADYTSWESLTDRRYCARELPPRSDGRTLPDESAVVGLFRRETFAKSAKSTVFFVYVAQWFTDGFLRSRRFDDSGKRILPPRDITTNDSTHHVDLGQVYGLTREQTKALRDKTDRWRMAMEEINGEDYPPALCDSRGNPREEFGALLTLGQGEQGVDPAQLRAMGSDAANTQIGYALVNTLFLRSHNAIADRIRQTVDWSDDHVFAAARNTLTVLTIKLVIEQYINHITPWPFRFRFERDGFDAQPWHRQNWVAVEFNLLYRWHCMIPPELMIGGQPRPLKETMFQATRLFTEHGLGALIDDASLQHAGAIELFNTDETMLNMTELPTIKAARTVGVSSYNDYREHCGFERVRRFEDISSDERVVKRLSEVYDNDIDAVEFYPGLFAEDRVTNSVVPPMMGRLVAIHALSQLLTNPLLAPAVYESDQTFSECGRSIINSTNELVDLVELTVGRGGRDIALTHRDWKAVRET